jgi:predicted nucleotidyltransferase
MREFSKRIQQERFLELLKTLADTGLVRVTGSYADGTQTEDSDIDFFVKSDKPDIRFWERNMTKIIDILQNYYIVWDSDTVGYVYTHKSKNWLPIPLEFSNHYNHREPRLKEVEIMGVKFKTY